MINDSSRAVRAFMLICVIFLAVGLATQINLYIQLGSAFGILGVMVFLIAAVQRRRHTHERNLAEAYEALANQPLYEQS